MDSLYTPKQVARAIQVSESSVKRWCDQGLIGTARTAGKHRRIPRSSVVQFLRATQRTLAHPEELGLPASRLRRDTSLAGLRPTLRNALVTGDEATACRLAMELYSADHDLAEICDELLAPVLFEVGELWGCQELEIYQERRGCELCLRSLLELRQALPAPEANAPWAFGGTLEGDHYGIPTLMAELVLRDAGWRAMSLGTGLPAATLQAAIEEHRPRIFWLSVSHIDNEARYVADVRTLAAACGSTTQLVIGGRALTDRLQHRVLGPRYRATMRELASTARESYSPAESRMGVLAKSDD